MYCILDTADEGTWVFDSLYLPRSAELLRDRFLNLQCLLPYKSYSGERDHFHFPVMARLDPRPWSSLGPGHEIDSNLLLLGQRCSPTVAALLGPTTSSLA